MGETAYLAQIKITLSNITSFAKVPSNCKMEEDEMICDLQNGNPLFSKHTVRSLSSVFSCISITKQELTALWPKSVRLTVIIFQKFKL